MGIPFPTIGRRKLVLKCSGGSEGFVGKRDASLPFEIDRIDFGFVAI